MNRFLEKHSDRIIGSLSCFDRVIFKGYLPLSHPKSMEALLTDNQLLIKDFGRFAEQHSNILKEHAKKLAAETGREFIYLAKKVRKEDFVKEIIARDNITEGLVCVLSALEGCSSFKLQPAQGRPRLVACPRKCLFYYFYYIDRQFGLMYIKIQSWLPMPVEVYINGHEWLAGKLDRHDVDYVKQDNVFFSMDDISRAQRFANELHRKNWPRILQAFAQRINPLLKTIFAERSYYWVIDQSEYSTDVFFESVEALAPLYKKLVEHGMVCLTPESIMSFLGRKINGNFKGDIETSLRRRVQGTCLKHWAVGNAIKMYDKFGRVLRVETVINRAREFRVLQRGKQNGREVMGRFYMRKGVGNMPRFHEVSRAANYRYLDAVSVVDDPYAAQKEIETMAQRIYVDDRPYRALNPAEPTDLALFAAVMAGSYLIGFFRNKDIRERMFPPGSDAKECIKQSRRVSRLLKLLHMHGLIAKIPKTRRWRVSKPGRLVLSCVLTLYHREYPKLFNSESAA